MNFIHTYDFGYSLLPALGFYVALCLNHHDYALLTLFCEVNDSNDTELVFL